MIIGSDSKRKLIFKSSPETKWKIRQLYLNGNIYLIKQIECDHMILPKSGNCVVVSNEIVQKQPLISVHVTIFH